MAVAGLADREASPEFILANGFVALKVLRAGLVTSLLAGTASAGGGLAAA